MARLLVIEPDSEAAELLKQALFRAGHAVTLAASGAEGIAIGGVDPPDAVIVELRLPDMTGIDACRSLARPDGASHTILVGDVVDAVLVEDTPFAADYLAKPFTVPELLRRIESVTARSFPPAPGAFAFGNVRVLSEAHEIVVDRTRVALTRLEMRLLCTLYERRPTALSRRTLLHDVWGLRADIDTRTVDTHVRRLRMKLGSAAAHVETVTGVGYRFVEDAHLRAK
jgi:two-component system phosphate regulon response regulator PhoB